MKIHKARQYIECYLSEQIPECDWYILLQENPTLNKIWRNYVEETRRFIPQETERTQGTTKTSEEL